ASPPLPPRRAGQPPGSAEKTPLPTRERKGPARLPARSRWPGKGAAGRRTAGSPEGSDCACKHSINRSVSTRGELAHKCHSISKFVRRNTRLPFGIWRIKRRLPILGEANVRSHRRKFSLQPDSAFLAPAAP